MSTDGGAEGPGILIVEDERVVAMALEEHLSRMGYRTLGVVSTGEEAVELSESLRPELVLMDIRLAGTLDGIEAAEIIRRRTGIPSVFLTAYADEATLRRAKVTEPFGYVIKPYETRVLQVTIEMALYRQRLTAERERALEDLRASEARFRQLARLSPVGIVQTDADGRYRFVNERWCTITGVDAADAQSDAWIEAISPADRDRVCRVWRRSVEGAHPFRAEYTLERPDGGVAHVLAEALPEMDSRGEVVSYIGTLTDVTELRETQDRLRAAEELVEDVAGNIPGFILRLSWQRDNTLRVKYASKGVRELLGIGPSTLTSEDFDVLSLVEERDRQGLLRTLVASAATLQTFRREFTVRTARSEVKWLRCSATPKRLDDGEVVWDGVLVDVTEEKRTEAYYGAILDNSPDAVVAVDGKQNIVLFNKGAERMFGYGVEEILGEHLAVLLPAESRAKHRTLVTEFAAGPEASRQMGHRPEIAGRRKDGTVFPAEAVLWRMRVDGACHCVAIVRDASERKKLEEQSRQSQKMEALGRLAGGVAHDFNNVLAGITGHAELGKLNLTPDDPLREECEEILKGCERAAALTRQLLVFSRRQVMQPRIVDVGRVVSGMDKLLRRLIREDIELILGPVDTPLKTEMDPGQLEQVILNLVLNARDAMPDGGRIVVDFRQEGVDEERARFLGGIEPGLYCTIDVSDTGMGIPAELLSRIFEPFFTTKDLGEGTGLGLSTVFGIVGKAGGHIRVDSTPGKGSDFRVYLPLTEQPVTQEEPAGGQKIERGTERILVVEDDEAVRRTTAAALIRCGYDVLSALNSGEALILAERLDSPIDLLLTDVVLPHMGGGELANRLQKRFPNMRTLFMSGYVGDPSIQAQLAKGPRALLEKPFSIARLTQRVREILDAAGS